MTAAILAGGLGSRIGGDKALVQLGGRHLISYPLEAAREAGLATVVVAKRATRLPPLEVPVILEPDTPLHPLLGVITALSEFPTVIALPCDMPFVAAADLRTLAATDADLATLWSGEPFPSLYRRQVLPQLLSSLEAGASVRSTQAQSSAPAAIASARPAHQLSVNTTEDLAAAETILSER